MMMIWLNFTSPVQHAFMGGVFMGGVPTREGGRRMTRGGGYHRCVYTVFAVLHKLLVVVCGLH